MFIDYVITVCDQILRRVADQNPGSTFLQNISPDKHNHESDPPKEAN